jgi:hypothetical protein
MQRMDRGISPASSRVEAQKATWGNGYRVEGGHPRGRCVVGQRRKVTIVCAPEINPYIQFTGEMKSANVRLS